MKPQILLVDDHQMARRALKLFLEQQGFVCEEADNGLSALAQLEAGHAIDLIISDNQMPEMTGMEFLTKLKNHSYLSSIPVILYSGNITEDLYIQAKKIGAQAVLPKPYKFGSLLETIKEILLSE
jgi:CheY-like chemotaxis protein